jgi:hypothetical protein
VQVVGFEIQPVDRLARVDVAGRLDGGDGGVVVEDFECDRVVVLLASLRGNGPESVNGSCRGETQIYLWPPWPKKKGTD